MRWAGKVGVTSLNCGLLPLLYLGANAIGSHCDVRGFDLQQGAIIELETQEGLNNVVLSLDRRLRIELRHIALVDTAGIKFGLAPG